MPPTDPEDAPGTGPRFYTIAWIFYLVLAVCAVIWIGWSRGAIPLALFVDLEGWWLDVALGAGAGGLLIALWEAGRRTLASIPQFEEQLAEHIGRLDGPEVFGLALMSGVAEELLFRGAVQGSWGFFWATLLFTLMHTGPGRAFRWWTVFALAAGALFGGLTLYRGNLLAAVLAHFLVNFVNLRRILLGGPHRPAPSP